MFGTIITLAIGWGLGRYWDQVTEFVKGKLNQAQKSDGGVTRTGDE